MALQQTAPASRFDSGLDESPEESDDSTRGDPALPAADALGAIVTPAGTRFRVHVTGVSRVQVRLVDAAGGTLAEHDLLAQRDGAADPGIYEALVPEVGHGALYHYVLDGKVLPDPFARALPQGVHGPAMVVASSYQWSHGPGIARPLREHVIYEIHVGTFTTEGTFAAAAARLPELATLGITAIELMPVAAFPGEAGWGYDGVALFAPFAPYGTPDDLRAFVDRAHDLGLSVFLDVVYNHFGPSGNYLSAFCADYFTDKVQNAWGLAPDFSKPPMRRLVLENARYWLREFRFDGLRLDATHAIVDPSERHILRELADQVATLQPKKLLIAEDERNEPDLIRRLGLDALWADDFHHALRVTLTGEQEGYYAAYCPGAASVAETICKGWLYTGQSYAPTGKPRGKKASDLPAESFVYCIQNHDQVGNRALGDRLSAAVSLDAYCVASTVLLFLPMTPLLFMGQEWAASAPFLFFTDHDDQLGKLISRGRREEFRAFATFASPELSAHIPDPQARATFERSRLDWSERAQTSHARVLQLYRDLIALRAHDPVLSHADRMGLDARAMGDVLLVRRWTETGARLLLANLGKRSVPLSDLGRGLRRRHILFQTTAETEAGQQPLAPGVVPETLAGHAAIILG
jgi:maltooligosyltrehalose trehalohydrolase